MGEKKRIETMHLVMSDGTTVELPDITEERFTEGVEWTGVSDTAYAEYKREHGFNELSDYRNEYLIGSVVVYNDGIKEVVMRIESVKDIDDE